MQTAPQQPELQHPPCMVVFICVVGYHPPIQLTHQLSMRRLHRVEGWFKTYMTMSHLGSRTTPSAHVGHTVHPSKVPKLNPQTNLITSSTAANSPNTFTRMSTYNAYVRDAPIGELRNPFAPLELGSVGYNLTRDIDMSSDNTSRNHQRWSGLSRMTGRGGNYRSTTQKL